LWTGDDWDYLGWNLKLLVITKALVQVKLRSLMPTADVHMLAVLSRVAMRTHLYTAMEANWAARPRVSVKADPRAWWRHSALRVLQECRKVRRRRTTLFGSVRKHRVHKRYQILYKRLHESNASFSDPNCKCASHLHFATEAPEGCALHCVPARNRCGVAVL
jgi:hypothetical protein